MFSEQELAYLQAQPLARIATVDNDGQPPVVVVGFQFDGARFYISGHQLGTMRKYKNIVAGHHKEPLIIDDLKSFRPWQPRGIRIPGPAEGVPRHGHPGPARHPATTPLA